jgi:hypothetical protein
MTGSDKALSTKYPRDDWSSPKKKRLDAFFDEFAQALVVCAVFRLRAILLFATGLFALYPAVASGDSYYAGSWDATLYNLSDHPHTVILRVTVEDSETRSPLADVEVTAEGDYETETGYGSLEPQEFELRAVTGRDGVAVFALSWHGDGGHTVDDIEKVRNIHVRMDSYRYVQERLDFSPLVRASNHYTPDSWKYMIRDTRDAKYFLPMIGAHFDDYNNTFSTRAELFRLVRNEDYGEVFRAKELTGHDFPAYFTTHNPQREAGPFMMIPITFRLERVFDEIRVTRPDERQRRFERQRREAHEEAERTARLEEQRRKAREEAERTARLEEQRRKAREEAERTARLEEQRRKSREEAERTARLEERLQREAETRERTQARNEARRTGTVSLGVEVRTISAREIIETKGFMANLDLVEVVRIRVGSPGARSGLRAGMVIDAVDHRSISSADEFPTEGRRGDSFRVHSVLHGDISINVTDNDFE